MPPTMFMRWCLLLRNPVDDIAVGEVAAAKAVVGGAAGVTAVAVGVAVQQAV